MQRMWIGVFVIAAMGLSAAGPSATRLQAEEWKMPNLNPFASSKPKDVSRRATSKSASWLPGWGSSNAPRKGPTTWQKVQAAPSGMMNKTKTTLAPLNPFKTASAKKMTPVKKAPPEKSSGWWPEWMTVEEEKGPPLTVSDWLNAPRPE